MKLKALDQISVSAVQADSLRAGQQFEISDAFGEELLKKHPTKFERLNDDKPQAAAETQAPAEKAEPAPINKAEPAPANKADKRRKHDK